MNAPPNAPPGCPRNADDSSGPRRCTLVECPEHLHEEPRVGRRPPRLRVLAQRECDDTCAVDVAERAHDPREPFACTLQEIAVMLAMDPGNVQRVARRALRKYRLGLLRVKFARAETRFRTPLTARK